MYVYCGGLIFINVYTYILTDLKFYVISILKINKGKVKTVKLLRLEQDV